MEFNMNNLLKKAIKDDGKEYLKKFYLPANAISYFVDKAVNTNAIVFLDWIFKDWEKFYHKIPHERLVKILFDKEEFLLPQELILDNTINDLDIENFKFINNGSKFKIPPDIKAKTQIAGDKLLKLLKSKKRYYHDTNLKLLNIIINDNKIDLLVETNRYKQYVYTNLVLDYLEKGSKQTLRQIIHSDGELEPMSESKLANNLGINGLVFTADNKLIIQKRSNKVAFRANQYVPSFSGTLTALDLSQKYFFNVIFREAKEEIGIEVENITEMHLLGITRELIRGGEPEVFVFIKTNYTKNELVNLWKESEDKYESKSIEFFDFEYDIKKYSKNEEKKKITTVLNDFHNKYDGNISVPLMTNIALIVKYYENGQ